MNFANLLAKGADSMLKSYKSHMPQVLTGICVAGIFGTGITSTIGTVKACKKVDRIKEERGVDSLSIKEIFKACWMYYIPAGLTAGVSSAAGIISCKKSTAANAMLATLLQTTEANRNDLIEAAEEVVGKKKTSEIEAKAAEKAIEKNPPKEENIFNTKYGDFLFRDSITGTFFRSTHAAVDKGILEFNKCMIPTDYSERPDEGEYCFGDLFREWGVDINSIDQPNIWIIQDTWCTHPVTYKIKDGHHPVTGEPCATIVWSDPPFDRDSLMWGNSWYN